MVERRKKPRNRAEAHPLAGKARLRVEPAAEVDHSKQRLTINLDAALIERVRNAVYWTPGLTLSGLAEQAIADAIEELERERGDEFPRRRENLRVGRPPK